ncbi:MAG: phospholipid carrier-dependent glycosyltransferase, partial [Anaerolineales bacterium]|nr:phospholipid carrier-dependent glycosyltransferase [Anaerolineales bacterium]
MDTGRDVCDNPLENPFWGYRSWEVGTDNKNMYIHTPAEAFPWQGEALAARLVRFLNVLVGAGTVLFVYATGRTIWAKRPWLAVGSTALIAFSPMFLYMAGTINNDVIASLSGAAVMYTCMRLLFNEAPLHWRWGIYFGLGYALALMSKF